MPDQVLQDIKDRLNVADVISTYIPVKRAGSAFKAVCPFHNEKSPSLMISPGKQIWHCFGCGEGGDIFGFVMRYENVEFKDALKILADRAGVKLPEYRPRDPKLQSEEELLFRINSFAAKFYHQVLLKPVGTLALEYLKKRGLNLETIKQWQVGFAPEDFHILEKALASKGIKVGELVKAGVSVKNERGQIYDRFRGRITFPIFNYMGEAVGFSARILNDDQQSAHSASSGQAKYVNSPETPIYYKSKVLFGLYQAKNEIRKKDEAVVVEGQMDCISVVQAGFGNVVATSGTALTLDQLNMIGRLTKNLKFCFDNDSAGQEAARRAGELALKQGFRLKVIILTSAKDPDELVKKSPKLWEKAVFEAQWFLDYEMEVARQKSPADNVAQLHYLSSRVIPLVGLIQDPLEQDHYITKLTQNFGISEKVVRQQIKPQLIENKEIKPTIAKQPEFVLEKDVLGAVLVYPDFSKVVLEQASLDDFESLSIREVLNPLFLGKSTKLDSSSTLAKEAIFMVESQLEELDGDDAQLKRQLAKSFALFKISAIKRQQQALQQEISQAEKNGNKTKVAELNQIFARNAAKRLEYEKQT